MTSDSDMPPRQMLFPGVAMNRPEPAKAGLEQGADPEAVLENGNTLATEAVLGGMGAQQTESRPETAPEAARPGGPLEKFADLYRQGVNGINVDLETDDIVRRVAAWDDRYGVQALARWLKQH